MEKRYFWFKMEDDFFQKKEIKKLRSIAGGDTFVIIYLKLILKSLKTGGKLYFEGIEDTFFEEIALELDESPSNVEVTLNYLLKKSMVIEYQENEFFINDIPNAIGSETSTAIRVRKHRDNQEKLMEEIKVKKAIPFIEKFNNNKYYNGYYYDIISRDKGKCVCGSDTNLNVHHIIGFRENLKESCDRSSMIVLCRKCHSQEHAHPHSIVTNDVLSKINFDMSLYDKINEISNMTGNKLLKVTCNTENITGNINETGLKQNVNGEKRREIEEKEKSREEKEGKKEIITLAWEKWLRYKNEQFKFSYKNKYSENIALTELIKLCEGDLSKADKIVNQSIFQGWKGLFPLRNDYKGNSGKSNEERARELTENRNRRHNIVQTEAVNDGK